VPTLTPPSRRCALRDTGAQLLVSAAAWWPGQWGPRGEWEARTLESGLPLIVCNRTGRDDESDLTGSESVMVDRGTKLLTLRAASSTLFMVECELTDGHLVSCELVATAPVVATADAVCVLPQRLLGRVGVA
jgi:omega-amidase